MPRKPLPTSLPRERRSMRSVVRSLAWSVLVGKDGVVGMHLIMRAGRFFRRDVSVPVSAIDRADAHGVYLNRTRAEIRDLTRGGRSSLGSIDLNTRKPADSEAKPADTPPAPSGPNDLATTSLPHVPDSR